MRRLAFLLLLPVFAVSGAFAAPVAGDNLTARFSGAELRFSTGGFYNNMEDHLWRFRPDGRVTGDIRYVRLISSGAHHVEKSDTGQWRVEGDRVCVDWNRFYWYQNGTICFQVVEEVGHHVTVVTDSGRRWHATLNPWTPRY